MTFKEQFEPYNDQELLYTFYFVEGYGNNRSEKHWPADLCTLKLTSQGLVIPCVDNCIIDVGLLTFKGKPHSLTDLFQIDIAENPYSHGLIRIDAARIP